MSFLDTMIAQELDGTAKANQAMVHSIIAERAAAVAERKAKAILAINEKIAEIQNGKKPDSDVLAGLRRIVKDLSASS